MSFHTDPAEHAYESAQNPVFQKKDRRTEQKRQRTIEIWNQPLWPHLGSIIFNCLIVLSIAMTLVEVKNVMLSPEPGLSGLLRNSSLTLLVLWAITLFPEALCFIFSSIRQRRDFYRRKEESGLIDATDEERDRSRRALRRLNEPCRIRLIVCLTGTMLFLLFFLITQFV